MLDVEWRRSSACVCGLWNERRSRWGLLLLSLFAGFSGHALNCTRATVKLSLVGLLGIILDPRLALSAHGPHTSLLLLVEYALIYFETFGFNLH